MLLNHPIVLRALTFLRIVKVPTAWTSSESLLEMQNCRSILRHRNSEYASNQSPLAIVKFIKAWEASHKVTPWIVHCEFSHVAHRLVSLPAFPLFLWDVFRYSSSSSFQQVNLLRTYLTIFRIDFLPIQSKLFYPSIPTATPNMKDSWSLPPLLLTSPGWIPCLWCYSDEYSTFQTYFSYLSTPLSHHFPTTS